MEDSKIIELFFARSERAIEETAKKYGSYLTVIARNILHRPEDTEEIVNDVYLAAWNTLPPNHPNVLKHYLSRIARNLSFKRFDYLSAEKRSADTVALLSELEDCIPDACRSMEEIMDIRELGKCINRYLSGLPKEECSIFVSRFYYAQTHEQLAKKYGCSVRQVKYKLEKLRKNFRAYLQKEGVHV